MPFRFNLPVIASVLVVLCCSFAGNVISTPPDKIIFNKLSNSYSPFSTIQRTTVEVRNNQLHFLAIAPNGDMLQIKDIPLDKVHDGIFTSSEYRTVYISAQYGTSHDDADNNPKSMLEIKCADNKPGNSVTVGIKTTLRIGQKNIRVYATLSGIIPSYIHVEHH